MRVTKIAPMFLAIVTLLALCPCLADDKTAYTGTEELISIVDVGTTETLPNGGRHVRNWVGIYAEPASDDRVAGYARVVVNMDLNSEGKGVTWGAYYSCNLSGVRTADGWEGTWGGKVFAIFPFSQSNNWIIKGIGRGIGANNGLKVEFTTAYTDSFVGRVVGVIQDLGK